MFDDNIFALIVGGIIASMKPGNQLKLVGFVVLSLVILAGVGLCLHHKEAPVPQTTVNIVSV